MRISFDVAPLLGLFLLWLVLFVLEVFVVLELLFSVMWRSFASPAGGTADSLKKYDFQLAEMLQQCGPKPKLLLGPI